MAPALSDAARKHYPEEHHPRRALTSVGNLSPHMEDEMGLQSAANLSKDSQDMEQMLVELGGGEIGQADLLQAIKTLESGGDGLSAGDADAIFPLSGFERDELLEGGDSESDNTDEKIRAMQARLERRSCFLLRRMRIHQARAIGKRVSEEAALTVDRCGRAMRRDGGVGRPTGLKSVLKRIETTATLQANAAARPQPGPSYYRGGREPSGPGASLGVAKGALIGSADTAAALRSHLQVVERQLDSDATASSSGAESNDETLHYSNHYQEPMPVERRALWHWQRRRASLAARWAWLQAQVQELEYKIRQHSDLHRQVRAAKGAVQFVGEPGGYEGPLPGSVDGTGESRDMAACDSCARVRPLRRDTFRKRKLLQMHNVHTAAPKAAKPADIRCGCQWPIQGCAVCTGRSVATQPLPPTSTLSARQRLGLLDAGYHPVLSDVHDVSPSLHMSALWSRWWWKGRPRTRSSRHLASSSTPFVPCAPAPLPTHVHHPSKKRKHSYTKLRKNRPSLTRKHRDTEDVMSHERGRVRGGGSAMPAEGGCGGGGPGARRLNSSSFDIDNIVIPPSVAATTRLEILHYKEIPTPKWRVLDMPMAPLNNGVVRHARSRSPALLHHGHSDEEDGSEASIVARHSWAEQNEQGNYARKKRTRWSNHQEEDASETSIAARHARAEQMERGKYALKNRTRWSNHQEEDASETSVAARHARAEQMERGKYARKKRTRRSNHQNSTESQPAGEGNGVAGSSLLSGEEESNPATEPVLGIATVPAAEINGPRRLDLPPTETVRPFSPRTFPLDEDTYRDMLQSMPQGHPLSSPELDPDTPDPESEPPGPSSEPPDEEEPPSPMSPLFYEDDPNDPEWEQEKEDKR